VETKTSFLTNSGKQNILRELEHLRQVRRKEVAERIRIAAETPDAYDSPEYVDAKDEQAFVEGRILKLENVLAHAVMIPDHPTDSDIVNVGSHVTVVDEDGEKEEYTIVGSTEANPRMHLISNESPVGGALIGHRAGDRLEIPVPNGVVNLTIVSIA
jgi:transcription elongation factor GreA